MEAEREELTAAGPVFPSKRDRWLISVLWLATVIMVGAAILLLMTTPPPLLVPAGVAVVLFAMAALIVWITVATRYRLADG